MDEMDETFFSEHKFVMEHFLVVIISKVHFEVNEATESEQGCQN